ncbi:MAG: hypothetical protein E4H33_02740 [Anaerolineales bacterium]|nr:MAG: hypothetical protein E4H33_02740 [Anaerolineales bacterium]
MIANISGTILYIFSLLVYRTCRFHISGLDQLDLIKASGDPVIITSWHGMTMMVAGFLRRHLDITNFAVIMPDDHRGDALEVFALKLGVNPIPMNLADDSTLGMGRKLVGLLKAISSGKNFLIHPDGPAGPAYRVKPGLSYIARKTGTKILPMGCYCRHAYHIPRWDCYTLPLPFSKVHIQLGSLITIPKDASNLDEVNRSLENVLNRLTAQATANYYEL